MSDSSGFTEAHLNRENEPSVPKLLDAPFCGESWNYEATVKKVEAIMARIEAGELELADVFDQFTAAVEYLQQCEMFLAQRQKQMDLLIETLTDEAEF